MTCSPQYIIAEFKRSYYPDLEASEMHLKDPSCLVESENATYITFHIPFRNCSTVRIQTPDHLEYSNDVIRRITQGDITFKMDMNFPITCRYDRNATLNDLDIEVEEDEGTGMSVTLSFYESANKVLESFLSLIYVSFFYFGFIHRVT